MEKNFSTEKVQRLIIICLIIALAAVLTVLVYGNRKESTPLPGQTAVIETSEDAELTDTSGGQIRIKINPVVEVKNGIMTNLNFANLNEDRLLRCKIIYDEKCIYDSGMIASGSTLKGDYIKTENLGTGNSEGLAEVYSYDTDGKLLGQTNVKIVLHSDN